MHIWPTKRPILIDISVSALAIAAFFYLSATHINLPGLYYDEAMDVVPTMQIVLGQAVEVWTGAGIHIGETTFPVMIMNYLGTVCTYLMLPFFYFLGVNVFSLRLMTICFGCLTIVLYYLFARDLLNRRVAAITILLLAVHPSFIFWSRQGIYVTSVMTFMAAGSLFCLLRWHRQRTDRHLRSPRVSDRGDKGSVRRPSPIIGTDWYLYAGAFLLGVGLSAKFLFIWFIVALAVNYYVFTFNSLPSRSSLTDRQTMWRILTFGAKARQLGLGLLSFCAGAGGLLWYNLKTWGTIKILARNLLTTDRGVNNLDVFSNLLTEIRAFLVLIKGNWFGFYGGSFSNSLYPVMFCVSVVGLAFLLFSHRYRLGWLKTCPDQAGTHQAKFLFLLSMVALILVQSCFTISGLGATHLLIVLPFPQLIIALFMETLYQVIAPKLGLLQPVGLFGRRLRPDLAPCYASVAMAMAVLALITLDVRAAFRYHQALQRSGGLGRFSDAIYELAEYLEDHHLSSPLAVDWGFKNNIQILTKGKVNPVEIFQYSWNPNEFSEEVYKHLKDPNNRYLFYAEEFASFERYDAFQRIVRQANKAIKLEQVFYQRDGRPVYYLYRVTTPDQGYSLRLRSGQALWVEGEEYEAALGTEGEDYKGAAWGGRCLGMGWGEEAAHFALYSIQVPEDVPNAFVYLRYAHPGDRARQLNIYLDGELTLVTLPASGGWGYEESEWAIIGVSIGHLKSGEHWIKIQPNGDHNAVNLDGFYIREAE